MKRTLLGWAGACLLAIFACHADLRAGEPAKSAPGPQQTPSPPAARKASAPAPGKKQTAGPFHGKLLALDKSGKTITMGKRTFHITSNTKILKGGKPATLNDGVVGEQVSGYFKAAEDGKLVAYKVTFGPKVEPGGDAKAGSKKQPAP